MGRRKQGRKVNGILLLDKALGVTSNQALQQVKHLYHAAKAGHTGSLDPLATGMLPICLGEATKLSAFLLDADKRYQVRVKLGEKTATGDSEGEIVQTRPVEGICESDLLRVLERFRGEIQQLPPMYSALKRNGERLYNLARKGIEVEREPRTVHIHSLSVTKFGLPEFELDVLCSKGTYVRTLAEDIGDALDCGAHVSALRRSGVGPYMDAAMVTIDELGACREAEGMAGLDALLLPLGSALSQWPEVHLTADSSFYMRQGQAIVVPKAPTSGWVRLFDAGEQFFGVGEILDDGKVAPKRIFQI